MNWLSSLGLTIIGIGVLVAVIVSGYFYIGHLQGELKTLEAANQQANAVATHDNEQLKIALADFKKQADILAIAKERALKEAKLNSERYRQIMEATNENTVISPILCISLVRVFEQNSSANGDKLSVPYTPSVADAVALAKSACKNITQKDVAAWLETQIYPAFKASQQQLIDLQMYTGTN